MIVTIDAEANTIVLNADSNAIAVSQSGGIVTILDPAAGNVSVTFGENAINVSSQGFVGATGPEGPQGPTGTSDGPLDDLTDVTITSVANGDLLKYSSTLTQWVNSNKLDGGNF